MKRICVISFLLLISKAYACLNIFAVDSTGNVHYLEHYFFFAIEHRQKAIDAKLKSLENKFKNKDYSFQDISDYGAYLLMTGRFAEGLDLFRALSKKYPDTYEIRANIAVAYELNGFVDSALFWQVAAGSLRPRAHNDSEWIHLKILEAKKKMLTDADWCLQNNVTGVADSIKLHYKFGQHEDGKGMWIFKQFVDQLEERLPFTYPGDKAMGKLLLELGDAYQVASIYRSYYCYATAKYLYPALSEQADEKMKQIRTKYPAKEGIAEGRKSRLDSGKEMFPPDESDVTKFINKLINRPGIKKSRLKSVITAQLIDKI